MFEKQKINYHLLLRRVCLILLDIVLTVIASVMALATRFEFNIMQIPEEFSGVLWKYEIFFVLITLIIFGIFRIYSSLWEYAGLEEAFNIIGAVVVSTLCELAVVVGTGQHLPRSYYVVRTFYLAALVGASRFCYRIIRLRMRKKEIFTISRKKKKIMLIGAGEAGRTLIQEIQNSRYLDQKVCCVIDDNSRKVGRFIMGIRVVGDRYAIRRNVEKYGIEQIIIAIPSAGSKKLRPILDICKETGCELKILPGMYQLVNGEVNVSKLRPVNIDDLLGREEITVNMDEILNYVSGKTILVTGGGGSIGSELCRQIAGHESELLVIFDIYENNAYDIEQELKASYPNLNLKVLIGSVRDSKRINWVFETYKPEIVYHAAAHKHVPLMENSPCEAIKNNVVGTYKTAYAAMMNGCQRFVLISTDKAVNPTNIMGASKRLCEMVVQSMNMVSHNGHTDWLPRLGGHRKDTLDALHDNEGQAYVSANHTSKTGTVTEFVAVRFGNVLGSNGSVIPLFKRQIEKGGPVTVTHPDIIRYFMTIPEAVSLVLQAGTYAKGGEIFVLDMGAPVKIDTLARNLIKLSGYTPDVDIKVTYTGLRPGEKLYEEKLMAEEGMEKTPNDLIHIGKPIEMDVQEFFKQLEVLAAYGYANSEKIRDIVAAIVPTYHSADSDLKLHKKVYEELMSEAAVAAEK